MSRSARQLDTARLNAGSLYTLLTEENVLRDKSQDWVVAAGDAAINTLLRQLARSLGYRIEKIEAPAEREEAA